MDKATKTYVVIKPFVNTPGGRVLPVGLTGEWMPADVEEFGLGKHLALYSPAQHGQLQGAWAIDVRGKYIEGEKTEKPATEAKKSKTKKT